jgi:hypothetical protein
LPERELEILNHDLRTSFLLRCTRVLVRIQKNPAPEVREPLSCSAMKRIIVIYLLLVLSALAVKTANAQSFLYGATGGTAAGTLFTLDPATGTATTVGALVDASAGGYAVTGLVYDWTAGVLYGSTTANSPTAASSLVIINPLTGLVTPIGSFNISRTMADLTFDSATGTLYGANAVNSNLYTINITTGEATLIGLANVSNVAGVGVAINSDGNIYGTPNGSTRDLVIYNPFTGAASSVFTLTGAPYAAGAINALAFDSSGVLYGLNVNLADPNRATHLVTIDLTSGAITDLGPTVSRLDAIAFGPIPEPSVFGLIVLAAAMGVMQRFRRGYANRPSK